jgi:hypothetical protein
MIHECQRIKISFIPNSDLNLRDILYMIMNFENGQAYIRVFLALSLHDFGLGNELE